MLASVSGDYLRTMRVPVLRGRALEAADFSGGQPVALVSEEAASSSGRAAMPSAVAPP